MQHNCLLITDYRTAQMVRKVLTYCMSELPSKFHIEINKNLVSTFTFDQLSKQNVTSEQLLIWSAPIDVIERYQFYLDQLIESIHDRSLEGEVFYKCELPRFGPT